MTDAKLDDEWEYDAYRDERMPGERGFPRGPIAHIGDTFRDGAPLAIGFCPRCHANARRSTQVRGLFDCPGCTHLWYDDRVGRQARSFDDYFSGGEMR